MKCTESITGSNCSLVHNIRELQSRKRRGMSGKKSESSGERVCSMKPADRFPMDFISRLQPTLNSGLQKGREGECECKSQTQG